MQTNLLGIYKINMGFKVEGFFKSLVGFGFLIMFVFVITFFIKIFWTVATMVWGLW